MITGRQLVLINYGAGITFRGIIMYHCHYVMKGMCETEKSLEFLYVLNADKWLIHVKKGGYEIKICAVNYGTTLKYI